MLIPPGAVGFEYGNRLQASDLARILGDDLRQAPGGVITLRQIHAHAHKHARSVSLRRTRNGQTTTLFEISTYCGYGSCQHFHDLTASASAAQPTIELGDALEFRCVYDNPDPYELGYGLSAMNEMCGPILVYTPHDPSLRPHVTWHDSDQGVMRPQEGEGPWLRSPQHHVTSRGDYPAQRA